MNRSLVIGIIVIVLILGAVAVGWLYYQANPDEWDSFAAEMSGNQSASPKSREQKTESLGKDGLQASGTIEIENINAAALSGGRVTEVFADESQTVAEGDLLAILDDSVIENSRLSLAAVVSQAEAALDIAQAQLEQAKSGPRSEEIAAAEGAVQSAAAAVDLAMVGVDAVESAIALGVDGPGASKHDLDAANAQVAIAEGQLAQAQAQLVLVSTGASEYDLDILEAQVRQAEAALDAASAALKSLDIELNNTRILAPTSGTILQRLIHPGEIALPAGTLFLIGDLTDLTLTVFIPEGDLGRISLGQVVQVNVDAYDTVFEGKVSHIASSAEFTPRNVQTQEERVHMVFAVEIQLDNSDGLLKPGMPADATFIGGSRQ